MKSNEDEVNRLRAEFVGKRLFLVFLLPTDKAGDRSAVRLEHFKFVKRLEAEGRLFAAGPYVDERTGKPTGEGSSSCAAPRPTTSPPWCATIPSTKAGSAPSASSPGS